MIMDLRLPVARGIAALGLLAPLALAACGDDPQSGGLTINYTFAPGVSCNEDQENVVDVQVLLGDEGSVASETEPCNNGGGEIVLAGVPAGTHDMFALGIDDAGDAVLDNLGGLTSDDLVEIIGGNAKTVSVELGLAPARLDVRFQVEIDDFGVQCTADMVTIKGLRVQAWSISSAAMLISHDFDLCDFAGYIPVPDPMRQINGRQFDTVRLQALDSANQPVGDLVEIELGAPVGAGKLLQLDVSCDDVSQVCDAQVLGGGSGTTTTTDDPTGDLTGGESSGGGNASTGGDTTAGGDTTGA